MTIPVNIGTQSILNYKRLSYQVWYALAEFIDNSTQSYFNYQLQLNQAYETEGRILEVRVVYDRETDSLRITDNAMGMSLTELEHAMQIASPPANTSGRSEFGLGMKTAACWLGDLWTVRTKKLGANDEIEVQFDVNAVAAGQTNLPTTVKQKDPALHYTVLEIRKMHQKLAGRTIGKTKTYLGSMYRGDVREGVLDLRWDQLALTYDDSLDLLKAADGSEYKKDFAFEINGKPVSGWVGILNTGGRPKAGFATIRRGRVIQGQPNAWRPGEIFGQDAGTNNLVNQRLVGELNLDQFMVSHTKNAILWQGAEEEDLEERLKEECAEYVYVANARRKGSDAPGPTPVEVDTAIDELRSELESAELSDLMELDEVPPPEVVAAALAPIVEASRKQEPTLSVKVGPRLVKVYLTHDASPNDPYFASDYVSDILVIVNTKHPYWSQLSGSDGVLSSLRQCVYDALAEWRCTRKVGEISPDTVKMIKDQYLRLPMEILNSANQ